MSEIEFLNNLIRKYEKRIIDFETLIELNLESDICNDLWAGHFWECQEIIKILKDRLELIKGIK